MFYVYLLIAFLQLYCIILFIDHIMWNEITHTFRKENTKNKNRKQGLEFTQLRLMYRTQRKRLETLYIYSIQDL